MRKRIQTNNDRKEERNSGRGCRCGCGCGCGMGIGTANGAVASVFGEFQKVSGGGVASSPCGGFICSEINKDGGEKKGKCSVRNAGHRKCTKK